MPVSDGHGGEHKHLDNTNGAEAGDDDENDCRRDAPLRAELHLAGRCARLLQADRDDQGEEDCPGGRKGGEDFKRGWRGRPTAALSLDTLDTTRIQRYCSALVTGHSRQYRASRNGMFQLRQELQAQDGSIG